MSQIEKREEEKEDLIEKQIKDLLEKRKKFDTIHAIILLSGLVFGYLSVPADNQGELLERETKTVTLISQVFRIINTAASPVLGSSYETSDFRVPALPIHSEFSEAQKIRVLQK